MSSVRDEQRHVVYGFNIRDPFSNAVRIDYVGRTRQRLGIREQQHRGRLAAFGKISCEQPWSDLIVGSAFIIESGIWSTELSDEREAFHIRRLLPRYNVVHNEKNPERIPRSEAIRMRDARDPSGSSWRFSDDGETFRRISLENFQGPATRRFSDDLAAQAASLITSWIVSGNIRYACPYVSSKHPRIERDTASELAGETIARTMPGFLRLRLNGWDGCHGRSILSYFVQACMAQYVNVYRAWYAEKRRNQSVLVEDLSLIDSPASSDVADYIATRDFAELSLSRLSLADRTVAVLAGADWGQDDIATHLGFTTRKVERILANRRAGIGWHAPTLE